MILPLPEAKRAAVDRGLMSTFGTLVLDGAQVISGGLSGAGLWRIRVGGIAYVLKIDGARDSVGDPVRAYACMRIAAAAFLAPRVRYADADDGVAIMDHVAPKSLALEYPGAGHELIVELAQTVRVLHETPAFPPLVDYLEGIGNLIDQHRLLDVIEPAATDDLFANYSKLRAGYRTLPSDLVSSHNDLNPGNIVYDGSRLWLVDWEAAFLADRYVDLATLAGWFTRDAASEEALLTAYFGAPAKRGTARALLSDASGKSPVLRSDLPEVRGERSDPDMHFSEPTLAGPDLDTLHQRLPHRRVRDSGMGQPRRVWKGAPCRGARRSEKPQLCSGSGATRGIRPVTIDRAAAAQALSRRRRGVTRCAHRMFWRWRQGMTLAAGALAWAQTPPVQTAAQIQARIERVLAKTPLIDGHNDFPWGSAQSGSPASLTPLIHAAAI